MHEYGYFYRVHRYAAAEGRHEKMRSGTRCRPNRSRAASRSIFTCSAARASDQTELQWRNGDLTGQVISSNCVKSSRVTVGKQPGGHVRAKFGRTCLRVRKSINGEAEEPARLTDYNSTAYLFDIDPYGVEVLTAGGEGNGYVQNPFVFKGGTQDRATGWVQFGNRFYDPTIGRWTQQDTLDAPLDPANANRYAFAGCDPINNADPTGKNSCSRAVGITSLLHAAAWGAAVGALSGNIPGALVGLGVGVFWLIISEMGCSE